MDVRRPAPVRRRYEMMKEGNCMIEIEKPQIECIETPGDATYGKYVVEPLERGYGTTLGNALRRIMLPLCLAPRRSPSRSPASSMSSPPFPV